MSAATLAVCFTIVFANIGFALFATGLCRAKNAAHTMTLNVMVIAVSTIGVFAIGFGLISGGQGFFLRGTASQPIALMAFALTAVRINFAVAIPIGALAERWAFRSCVNFTLMLAAIVFPIYASWISGAGWLARLGGIDYAGASVIHLQGGMVALITAWLIGPRLGKYDANRRARPILGHHVPMAIAGSLILSIGLLAMNAAPSIAADDGSAYLVLVNSLLAAAAAVTSASLYLSLVHGKFDPTLICNGMIGGLVSIAAAGAFVAPWEAIFIGAMAGLITIGGVFLFEQCGIDDPVGVISMHGLGGVWGVLALGFFANAPAATGLFFGNGHQLMSQVIVAAVCTAWSLLAGGAAFLLTGLLFGPNRVPRAVELAGLDLLEVGVPAYPDFVNPLHTAAALPADPRPASSPSLAHQRRFSVVVEGIDSATLIHVWSSLCQVGQEPPSAEFVEVYRNVTTVIGNRFRFSGGDATTIRDNLVRLFQSRISNGAIAGKVEN